MAGSTTSNVIKCKSCNIVICEVLAFIQNKQNVMTADSLVKVCTSAFSTKEIESAKTLLYDSLVTKQKSVQRKSAGKSERNLNDMISIFRNSDPEELPIFVAKDLHRLPPLTFDHVDCTRLLKDILVLKNELSIIKETYVTEKQLIEIKNEVVNLKQASLINDFDLNINRRRGGGGMQDSFCLDSGPMGLPPFMEKKIIIDESCSTPIGNNVIADECEISELSGKQLCEDTEKKTASTCNVFEPVARESEQQQSNSDVSVRPKVQTYASIVNEAVDKVKKNKTDGIWEKVPTYKERKQRKHRLADFEGKAAVKPNEKFRAADIKIPLFVHQVNKQTSCENIVEYIEEKTGVVVDIKKINMLKRKRYDAYKILVPHTTVSVFLDDSLWPAGVKVRRFVYFNRDMYDQNKGKEKINDKNNLSHRGS